MLLPELLRGVPQEVAEATKKVPGAPIKQRQPKNLEAAEAAQKAVPVALKNRGVVEAKPYNMRRILLDKSW